MSASNAEIKDGDPISTDELEDLNRDELLELVHDLSAQVDGLSSEVASVKQELNKHDRRIGENDQRIAKFMRFMKTFLGLDSLNEFDAVLDETESFRHKITEAVPAMARRKNGVPQIEVCEKVAHEEIVRLEKKHMASAAVDVGDVREIIDRSDSYDFEPDPKTVKRAFKNLADSFDELTVQEGKPGPHTRNTKLVLGGVV